MIRKNLTSVLLLTFSAIALFADPYTAVGVLKKKEKAKGDKTIVTFSIKAEKTMVIIPGAKLKGEMKTKVDSFVDKKVKIVIETKSTEGKKIKATKVTSIEAASE